MSLLDHYSLKGKVALITGGAGRYGKNITRGVAEAGATTYIASRNFEANRAYAEELTGEGYDVRAMQLDLSCEESMDALVGAIITEFGKIDILVNNAVIRCAMDGWQQSLKDYDKSLHINASALFYLTNLVAEEMKKRKYGSIVNIGSMMGLVGIERSNYNGTPMHANPSPIYFYEKGGMANFTRFAASMLGEYNIRVNCIHPGGLYENSLNKTFVKNYSERTQLGRMAEPDELNGAVVFLASDAASYITGVNMPVDGGYTAK